MKIPTNLRIVCTVCMKGTLVTEDLDPKEVVARHAALCSAAGLIEIPSIVAPEFPDQPKTVFVCDQGCAEEYESRVGPFRLKQMRTATGDMR